MTNAPTVQASFMADVVSGRIQLPTISKVVQQLILSLRKQDISFNDIALLLEQDPVLSARVLRLANSPFYCGVRKLASIQDAVSVIGTNALQTLVLACGVSSAFVTVPGVNLRQFWLDSVTTAAAARALAQTLAMDAESAYSAGLLSGAGQLILCQAFPLKAQAEFTRYSNLRGLALAAKEQETFGIMHPVVGALWADKLAFPSDTVQAIEQHLSNPDVLLPPLARLICIARSLAASALDGLPQDAAVAALDPRHLDALQLGAHLTSTGFARLYDALGTLTPLS
jgi:HD-like signal output (HDOD) protein